MSNREMNLDVILVAWNDPTKSNDQIVSELRFPSFQVLKTKVSRCPRKNEFMARPASFVPVATCAAAPVAAAPAAVAAPAAAPAPVQASPAPAETTTEEVSVDELAEPTIRVAVVFDRLVDGAIREDSVVMRGKASETEKFQEALTSLKSKYSLGQGDWLDASNAPVTVFTDGTILRFKPLVRAGK